MTLKRLRLALALAAIFCASTMAFASDCYTPPGSNQCYPTQVLINPATGQPYAASSGGAPSSISNTGFAAYGPDAVGGAPSKPPVLMGLLDGSGNVRQLSPSFPAPTADTVADAALDTPADAAAGVGANGSTIAQLKQAVTQLAAIVAKLPTGGATAGNQTNVQSAPGTAASTLLGVQGATGMVPFAVSWANQAVTANQGTAAAVANAWPVYQTVAGSAVSTSNPLPTADTNEANTIAAPGSAPTKAQTVQGVTGGVPLMVQAAFAFPVTAGQYTGTLNNSGVGVGYLQMDKRQLLKNSETGSDDPLVGISDTPTQAGTSNVAKAAAGNLYTAQAVALAPSTGQEYLVTINASAVPAAGATITPLDVVPIGSGNAVIGNTASINYAPGPPEAFSTGIVALVTTTLATYTAGGNAFIKVRVR